MKLTLLGTSACESVPAMWCQCEHCLRATRLGGKDVRRRSSCLAGSGTLVDFGPDANWQMNEFGISLHQLECLLFTHSHADHFNPVDLMWRSRQFSDSRPLQLMANQTILRKLEKSFPNLADLNLEPTQLAAGQVYQCGDTEILPVKASHAPEEDAFNFILSEHDRRILVAFDTGWWCDESWELVKGGKLDLVLIECSMGVRMPYALERQNHLGALALLDFRDKLAELGAVTSETLVIATHISHRLGMTHAELEEYFRPHGVKVGYDGMEAGD